MFEILDGNRKDLVGKKNLKNASSIISKTPFAPKTQTVR